MKRIKRAICLAGGGPALTVILGAEEVFIENDIKFDIISASCIGAWVAVVENTRDGATPMQRLKQTYDWFKPVFQPKDVHDSFPIARVFAPDYRGNAKAHFNYLTDPKTYRQAIVPMEMYKVGMNTLKFMMSPQKWLDESTQNLLLLEWMGAHPMTRLVAGMEYRTMKTGGARIHYSDAPLLRDINISNLYRKGCPEIRYSAINLSKNANAELFTNRSTDDYNMVDTRSLCACSALPAIFAPIQIGLDTYCEGATVDTVQAINLLEDHPDLDEIWIVRIVSVEQAEIPRDLTDATANGFMILAGALGAANIRDLRTHAKDIGWKGKIIEVPVPRVRWEWSIPNFALGARLGAKAARETVAKYSSEKDVAEW